MTSAGNLYVTGILVCQRTLALDDGDNVSRVHHEQERAHYRYLQHAELDDVRCRLPAAVTHMLPTLVQVRAKPRQDGVVQTKRSSPMLEQMVWSTVSKAADRSSRARAAMSQALSTNRMSDMSAAMAVSVDLKAR